MGVDEDMVYVIHWGTCPSLCIKSLRNGVHREVTSSEVIKQCHGLDLIGMPTIGVGTIHPRKDDVKHLLVLDTTDGEVFWGDKKYLVKPFLCPRNKAVPTFGADSDKVPILILNAKYAIPDRTANLI